MKIVSHRHPGIDPNVWAAFLTNRQLRWEVRRMFRTSASLDPASNPRLDLLLTEAARRDGLKNWLTRCQELLAANTAAIEANKVTSLPPHERTAS